jgi:hypothetical protein
MNVGGTWMRTVFPRFQHSQQDSHQQHLFTLFQPFPPFNNWLLQLYKAPIAYSSCCANLAAMMHGNGG